MKMKPLVKILATLLLALSCVVAQESTDSIRNFLRINKDFCTGGQPKLEHLEKLKAEGVKAIINLRQPSEYRAAEEEAKAKELGLRYFNIPVAFADPKEEQATEFLRITDDPENRPAFIHCTAAIRVGTFWMIRRVLRDGWSIEDAEKEAEKVGLRNAPHLNEFARKYIEKHRKSAASIPSTPLKFGVFEVRFDPSGAFTIGGYGWPKINGTWKSEGSEIVLSISGGPGGCDGPGRYKFDTDGKHLKFDLVSDECKPRQMILDRSTWSPVDERLPVVGSGFSASPIASDDKIYLSNEDGEILVVAAGEKFAHVATNSMGELLMATPAISEGVMYVRSSQSLFAIGKKK
jgi:protein tyrosine phosphatase (PTP) superfamily phosphohydrolase (DUF442 family)